MMRLLIIGIFLATVAFGFFLKYLTYSRRNASLPANVRDVFDEAAYAKNQAYSMETLRYGIVTGVISTLFSLAFLLFNLHAGLYAWVLAYTQSVYLTSLFILGVPLLVGAVLDQLLSIYSTFVIEAKYGFNKTTPKTFVVDFFKELLLMVVLLGGLLTLFLWLHGLMGDGVFVTFFFVLLALSLLMRFLSPLLVRIFNKLTPLEDGPLKDRINALASQTGYKFKGIYTVDASRRSTKLNAFAAGFGKTKTIGLYDTLIEKMPEDEVIAVLAHEIGHAKKGHVLKSMPLSLLYAALMLAAAYFVLTQPAVSQAFGFEGANMAFGMYVLSIMLAPVMLLLQIPSNALSRKHEYEADRMGSQLAGAPAMASSLKTLYRESFGNLTPHPFVVMLEYSHPPLSQRLDAIEKNAE